MSIITDILKEIPLSAVFKERLTEAETKMATLEKENATLKAENQNLRVDLQKAHDEIQRLTHAPRPTVVHSGGKRLTREDCEGL